MTNTEEMQENFTDNIKLVAVGDILIGVEIQRLDGSIEKPLRKDPISAFTFVSPALSKADIAFCNLESPLSDKGKRAMGRMFAWRASPKMVSGLTTAGFNVVNLANNHSMNFGPEALMDTISVLAKNKIAYIGAGRNIFEARKPVIIERKKTRIAFLGYSTNINQPFPYAAENEKPGIAALMISPLYPPPHTNKESLEMIFEDIRNTRHLADITIFSCHWSLGLETASSHTLAMHQPAVTHAAIDAGADLVLGHGPHLLQGIEVYKGKVIFYNLGQFVVDREVPDNEKQTIMVNCEISGKQIHKVCFSPVLINEQGQPQVLPPEDENCRGIQQVMDKLSRKLGTTLSFEGAEGVVKLGTI